MKKHFFYFLMFLFVGTSAFAQTTYDTTATIENGVFKIAAHQKNTTVLYQYKIPKGIWVAVGEPEKLLKGEHLKRSEFKYFMPTQLFPFEAQSAIENYQVYLGDSTLVETTHETKFSPENETATLILITIFWILIPGFIIIRTGAMNAGENRKRWQLGLFYLLTITLVIVCGLDISILIKASVFILSVVCCVSAARGSLDEDDIPIPSVIFLLCGMASVVLCHLMHDGINNPVYKQYVGLMIISCVIGFIVRERKARKMKKMSVGEIVDNVFLVVEQPGPHHPSTTEIEGSE